ncbi:prolyl oligopeptidase family serine peptidase [Acetobacter garciniae]|uniref:prolyl oligopeptidase family serine peptidase n=1 Tax=Acetobacter garciniae TaxID=2817435 RepID=UPI001E4892F1|nr:prolyl oligopeptidase family serine peptidase [Acetobacter garciniae]
MIQHRDASGHVRLPFGSWPSPVTAALVAGKTLTFSEVNAVGRAVYWLERRPAEGGRTVLMRWTEREGVRDVMPPEFDVGTRVHEYGGGPYAVGPHGIACSDRKTGRVWFMACGPERNAATDGDGAFPTLLAGADGLRFADLRFDRQTPMVLAVREDHRAEGEPRAALVVLGQAAESTGRVLVQGADFYAAPALSPDGATLAWIEWNHPAMPWDATRLCVGHVARGADGAIMAVEQPRVLAGADGAESLGEPRWTHDGRLLVISDRSGAWRVWEAPLADSSARQKGQGADTTDGLRPYPAPAGEIGQPAWVFGQRSYVPLPDGGCLFLSVREGTGECLLRNAHGQVTLFAGHPEQCPVPLEGGGFAWLDAPPDALPAIMVGPGMVEERPGEGTGKGAISGPGNGPSNGAGHAASHAPTHQAPHKAGNRAGQGAGGSGSIAGGIGSATEAALCVRRSAPPVLARQDISCAVSLNFPVPDLASAAPPVPASSGAGVQGHAFFYPPTNARFCGPEGQRPPLIVQVHGGPTARAQDSFSFKVQWWTSRGFAVLDVNYGGSTGFGRAWRNRLLGQWGVVDVADCIAAAREVIKAGLVDANRIAIRGSSAGGMTVLVALAESDLFAAGVSLYGVTDLRALAQETHKFESRYLDGLIGPWPQAESLYLARSPLSVAARISAPVLLLQGMEDKVVPPSQAHAMARALHAVGTPCHLREFPGEGHGFRKEATIRTALEEELAFYGRVFGFTPYQPDGIDPSEA